MKLRKNPSVAGKRFCGFLWCSFTAAALAVSTEVSSELYTQGPGKDATFQELIDQGVIVKGSKDGKAIAGTKIDVNNSLLESNIKDMKGTVRPDRIHTHVSSNISKKAFDQWSRWYQEDGNTQVFRLFKGEQSVRSLSNIKAGRIEAVKSFDLPESGGWVEWQGTYTIAKPGNGCIFQLMVEKDPATGKGGLWPVHIRSNGERRNPHAPQATER